MCQSLYYSSLVCTLINMSASGSALLVSKAPEPDLCLRPDSGTHRALVPFSGSIWRQNAPVAPASHSLTVLSSRKPSHPFPSPPPIPHPHQPTVPAKSPYISLALPGPHAHPCISHCDQMNTMLQLARPVSRALSREHHMGREDPGVQAWEVGTRAAAGEPE